MENVGLNIVYSLDCQSILLKVKVAPRFPKFRPARFPPPKFRFSPSKPFTWLLSKSGQLKYNGEFIFLMVYGPNFAKAFKVLPQQL